MSDNMSHEQLDYATSLIKSRVDWSKYPTLAARFRELPTGEREWRELVLFSLFCLEEDGNAALRGKPLLRECLDALNWCSGSDDFQLGGKAQLGWDKGVRPLQKRLVALLGDD